MIIQNSHRVSGTELPLLCQLQPPSALSGLLNPEMNLLPLLSSCFLTPVQALQFDVITSCLPSQCQNNWRPFLTFVFFLEGTDFTADFIISSQGSLSRTEFPDAFSCISNSTEIKYGHSLWALLTRDKMISWRLCYLLKERAKSQVVVGFYSVDIYFACDLVTLSSLYSQIYRQF